MELKNQFTEVLAEFNRASGLHLELSPEGTTTLEVGEDILNLQYLPASASVLAWTTLGFLGEDVNAPLRTKFLLEKHDAMLRSRGFVFSLDPEDRNRVLVHDVRKVTFFENGDRLAAWLEDLLELTRETREELSEAAPYVDDEPFDDEEEGKEVR